jgi:hypothetical protein
MGHEDFPVELLFRFLRGEATIGRDGEHHGQVDAPSPAVNTKVKAS